MAGSQKVDFYGGKPSGLPRFVYRRLAAALRGDPQGRAAAISSALDELLTGANPDLRKFKFTLPPSLRSALSPAELADVQTRTTARREHAARLKMVYPHVSDEFSLDPDFLLSVLDMEAGPSVAAPGRVFTIGSCFARNIAEFLNRNGRAATTFALAEDLNSPISNAFIFDILRREPADRLATLTTWVRRIFPEADEAAAAQAAGQRLAGLEQVAQSLRGADCVVLTLGNVVDFFREDAGAGADLPLAQTMFPKFVAMPNDEDITVRSNAAARLKTHGATLRLATYRETQEAITACIAGIRRETAAPIVVTLSPVPVDSVIGLAGGLKSAIEVDCVSKARLRSAFDELGPSLRADYGPIHYFPSFEIVRWIAPMLPIPAFGLDDAASRHVSSPILDAICELFLTRFVTWAPAEQPGPAAAAEVAR